jgi:hypothetical protein
MATAKAGILSSKAVADRFGVALPQAVKIIDRLGLGHRVGRHRAILTEDLPKIEDGLIAAGYLRPREAQPAGEAATC